jgi:hypothetical protein
METIINRLNGCNLKIIYENDTYYAVDRDDIGVKYDIKNKWKYIGDGTRYLKNATKYRIISEARTRASYDNEIKRFVEWYDLNAIDTNPNSPIIVNDTPKEETNNDIINVDKLLDGLKSIENTIKENNSNKKFEQAIIDGIIEKTVNIEIDKIENTITEYAKEFIDKTYGKLPSTIEIIDTKEPKHIEGLFHKNFETILQIVGQQIPLMLIGPAGSGKNHTLEQVAEALNLPFYFSNSITQEYKLTGFIDAGGIYHETEFYKAFTTGGLFFFDEIDASCAESLIIINAALANGYFDFPNGRVNAHPDFTVVAAANTFGNGADMIYVGRNQLDGATLDRFATMEFDYDENIEKTICADDELYNFIIDVRKAVKKRRLRFVVSMRATINASKMLKAGIDKKTIVSSVITKSMTKDDINTIINEISRNSEWLDIMRNL